MAVSPLVNPFCLGLGILGLVQALIIFILSLLGVLVHICVIPVGIDASLTEFTPVLVGLYFQGVNCQMYEAGVLYNQSFSELLTPEQVFPWLVTYTAVTGCWIIFSILIMTDTMCEKKTLHYFLPFWIILALTNCVMDVALSIQFFVDYTALMSNLEVHNTSLLIVVPFTMMILSLKGGTLWLINLFGGFLGTIAWFNFVSHKDDVPPLFLERAGFLDTRPIRAFGSIEVPRPISLHLPMNNGRNVASLSALKNYYLSHNDIRSDLQSPIGEGPAVFERKPAPWDIPEPDYSPTSTVTRMKNATDSQSSGLRHSLFNPPLPLRTSMKKNQQNYERKEDISL